LAAKPQVSSERWSRWQDVRPQSVSSRIVEQVRAALFRGELKPGDVLGSESDLARKFGVSRVPVRDAFKTLQALGIVEVKMGANGGARVAAGDPNRFADALAVQLKLVGISVEEMFDAQIAVEVMAAELAAKRATEGDLENLRGIVSGLQAMAQKSFTAATALRFSEIAMDFHAALVEAAHNRAPYQQLDREARDRRRQGGARCGRRAGSRTRRHADPQAIGDHPGASTVRQREQIE